MIFSEEKNQFFEEKVEYVFSNQRLGEAATLINGLILALFQWNHVSSTVIIIWVSVLFSTVVFRYIIALKFRKRDSKDFNIHKWYNLFLAGLILSGIIWGSAGIFLHPANLPIYQMVTVLIIGGMVAGASAVYAPISSAFYFFSFPAVIPAVVYSFICDENAHIAIGTTLLLFLIIMSITSHRNRKIFEASLTLKLKNSELISYLSKAKSKTDETNKKLIAENRQREIVEQELERHRKNLESLVEKRTTELTRRNDELKLEISERERAEFAFRASEERYRILIENSIVGILLIRDEKIIFANSMCSSLCGYKHEEIIGKSFLHFVHQDDVKLAVSNHKKRLSGEKADDNYNLRIINNMGEPLWVQVNATFFTYEGKPTILTILKDITQQRHLEMQVIQSEKMASIGQLAAGVAHEINNPVGFVSSNLHTLKEYQQQLHELILLYKNLAVTVAAQKNTGEDDDIELKQKKLEELEKEFDIDFILDDFPALIRESEDGINRVKKIVSDLKNYAHPGNESMQMADINYNIDSTLSMVWNELKYHVEVIKEFENIPEVECYPQLLNQVFMNLIVNAAQAIEGKGTIRINTYRKNSHVEIRISDTGTGIPKENITKIYDPFFTTKDVGKGTGLGLNVCYNIVKKHNGTIAVDSEEGKGTTFTITLPFYSS